MSPTPTEQPDGSLCSCMIEVHHPFPSAGRRLVPGTPIVAPRLVLDGAPVGHVVGADALAAVLKPGIEVSRIGARIHTSEIFQIAVLYEVYFSSQGLIGALKS